MIAYEPNYHGTQFCFVLNSHAYHSLDFCVPVNMACAIMSFWEIDIENFSAVINHAQKEKTPYLAGSEPRLLACRAKF